MRAYFAVFSLISLTDFRLRTEDQTTEPRNRSLSGVFPLRTPWLCDEFGFLFEIRLPG
jgi:hypothetical protein